MIPPIDRLKSPEPELQTMRISTQDAPKSLILHAPNVHQGGGRTLLAALLSALPADARGLCQLDARLDLPLKLPAGLEEARVQPSLSDRFQAERRLAQTATDSTRTLCFNSLPPLFRCRGEVAVFVQNRYLISDTDISDFPWRQQLRITVERQWFLRAQSHAHEFIVQSETMQQLLRKRVGARSEIRVLPLAPAELAALGTTEPPSTLLFSSGRSDAGRGFEAGQNSNYDYCYIATGEPHKNHRVLIEAWIELSRRETRPSLCLTLDQERFPDLCRWLDDCARQHNLRITNVGYISDARIAEIYENSRALVYPSQYESFGLPLLEAQQHGLEIIAPELDYVRDLIAPDQTFDASSSRSLARAIERSLGIRNLRHPPISGTEFYRRLFAA